jgi:hypothetical protein
MEVDVLRGEGPRGGGGGQLAAVVFTVGGIRVQSGYMKDKQMAARPVLHMSAAVDLRAATVRNIDLPPVSLLTLIPCLSLPLSISLSLSLSLSPSLQVSERASENASLASDLRPRARSNPLTLLRRCLTPRRWWNACSSS